MIEPKPVYSICWVSALLFDQWKLQQGEEDFTLLIVVVDGCDKEVKRVYPYNLSQRLYTRLEYAYEFS